MLAIRVMLRGAKGSRCLTRVPHAMLQGVFGGNDQRPLVQDAEALVRDVLAPAIRSGDHDQLIAAWQQAKALTS